MEWSRSSITTEEMERRQREYIEAAMKMAKRAASVPEPEISEEIVPEEKKIEFAEAVESEEMAVEASEFTQSEQETANQPEEAVQNEEKDEEKTTFGVFDREELEAAAENGAVNDEGLKRAAEILAEMSEKTEEMRRVYGQTEVREQMSSEPQSLGGYVNRHNGGSCPKCGQMHNGSRR